MRGLSRVFRLQVIVFTIIICMALPLTVQAGAKPLPTPYEDATTGLYGYKHANGTIVIEPRFQMAQPYNEQGLAYAYDKQWVLLDLTGKVLLTPYPFDNGPDYFVEGLARFTKNGKIGFYNEAGRIVIPALYDFAFPFKNGRARICNGCKRVPVGEHHTMQGGDWGEIDKSGRLWPVGK